MGSVHWKRWGKSAGTVAGGVEGHGGDIETLLAAFVGVASFDVDSFARL